MSRVRNPTVKKRALNPTKRNNNNNYSNNLKFIEHCVDYVCVYGFKTNG